MPISKDSDSTATTTTQTTSTVFRVEKIEGNSQGYKLFFENVTFPVPVSKGYIDKLKELI